MRLNVLTGILLLKYAIGGVALAETDPIEVIVIKGQIAKYSVVDNDSITTPNYAIPSSDIADLLKSIPGANVNANGPVSKIAQYRGLYGDKIATSVDGLSFSGAGPNAMDAPLSYGSPLTTESIEMTRGISAVSSGVDTIGGSLKVNTIAPEIDNNFGHALAQYSDNGNQYQLGALANMAMSHQTLLFHLEENKGNTEIKDGDGRKIVPSTYDKEQFGLKYLNQLSDKHQVILSYQGVRTGKSASPALPMDIDFIHADRVKVAGDSELNLGQLHWHMGWQNARHGMSNDLLRPLMDPMMARYNRADSTGIDAKVSIELGQWQLGVDYQQNTHDSLITNPNNPMMVVDNFKDVKSQVISAFGQWQEDFGAHTIKLGIRGKQYNFDAEDVNHSMAMMNPNVKYLMDKFNAQDKSTHQFGVDLVAQWLYQQSETINWRGSMARKQSSPSYQQRYLWLPMQATGGLADGRTYIGNVDLDLETAYQTDFGFDYLGDKLTISPRVFWQKINNYVQGVPLTDMKAVMVAKMMGDNDPLMFANTDAKLYGMDVDASYQLTDNWMLAMNATYTRGKRSDINDNLYRIAPLSGQVALKWQNNAWRSQLVIRGAARQDKVSAIQKELISSGYGAVDILTAYETDNWIVKAGISNLMNKAYADHLGGINRVLGQDIPKGEHLPSEGRKIWASILVSW